MVREVEWSLSESSSTVSTGSDNIWVGRRDADASVNIPFMGSLPVLNLLVLHV